MATTDGAGSAEEGEACLGCKGNRCNGKLDVKLASALRKVTFLTAVNAVLCVLTLAACGCSVFLYYKVNSMRAEMIGSLQSADEYGYDDPEYLVSYPDYPAEYSPPDDMQADTVTPIRLRRKKGGKGKGCKGGKQTKAACKCCVRKIRSLIKAGDVELPTKAPLQTTASKNPPDQGRTTEQQIFGAAHYTTAVDNAYIRNHFPAIDPGALTTMHVETCKNVTEWNGRLCRNRTFSSPAAPTTLKMLKEASWMANVTRIFDYRSDGSFVAKYTGVYLLYAHVLFFDVKTKQALGLLHKSGGEDANQIRCMANGADYATTDLGHGQKSCNVISTIYIEAGDTLQVQSLYANTEIDLTVDATYFGGVLLSLKQR